jgi:hypothetical protein
MSHETTEIDEAFIGRVYRTSVYVWGLVALLMLSLGQWWAAIGWTLGSLTSVGVLWSIEWIVRRAFVPDNEKALGQFKSFTLIKLVAVLPILGLAAWCSSRSVASIFAFCAGVVLTQAVIFSKVVLMLIRQRSND